MLFVSSYTLIIAAFAGALISTGFILLSRKMTHMATTACGWNHDWIYLLGNY